MPFEASSLFFCQLYLTGITAWSAVGCEERCFNIIVYSTGLPVYFCVQGNTEAALCCSQADHC